MKNNWFWDWSLLILVDFIENIDFQADFIK